MANFPATSEILGAFGDDPFAFEDPLSLGGKWAQVDARSQCALKGQAAIPGHEFIVNRSYWTQVAFRGDNPEVWACTNGGQLGAALETWRVSLWMNPLNMDGYELYFGGGISKGFVIRNYTGGNFVDIAGTGFPGYPTNIGLRINGDDIEAWGSFDGGVTWTLQVSVANTAHRGGAWYLGIALEEQGGVDELSISCFGGGVPHRTQFFRWLHN